jgi:MFS family permease
MWGRHIFALTPLQVPMTVQAIHRVFYGWRVVGAAFILAVFGWGIGFYGPPLYLHALQESRHWPLALISAAVSAHFVIGAIVVANLPALYRRFGLPAVTKAGAISLALGICGWAAAGTPWQLFAATAFSGFGWSALGPAAVNAIIAPWFVRTRPAALGAAYNGASVGGVIYSPLLAFAISLLGFSAAAALSGFIIVVTIWFLADTIFSRTPQQMGLSADGGRPGGSIASITSPKARPLPGTRLWRSRAFATLAAAMALGLFAQVGLIAHLFSLLVPALGTQLAGWAMGLAAACAIGGRTLVGWLMPVDADRRLVACASYAVQIVGSLALLVAAGGNLPLLLLGVVLFGLGIGNATSLPPLIAQVEFVKEDVQRAVALTVAISQAVYAFAPLVFGLIRSFEPAQAVAAGQATTIFIASAVIQALAIACLLIGRRGNS